MLQRSIRVALLACAASVAVDLPIAAAPKEIRIGGTLPLTGADATPGTAYREGYTLAVEQANRSGGVLLDGARVPVRLVLQDDASDRAKATAMLDKLLAAHEVDVVLGTYSSGNTDAQADVAEKHQVPLLSGGGAAASLYGKGRRFLFGLLSPVRMLAAAQMDWIEQQQRIGKLPRPVRIALVWEDTAHGQDFRTGILKAAARAKDGVSIVLDESFALNATDFKPLAGRVKAARADAFLGDAHLPDYIALHRQLLAAGVCHKVTGYGARGSEKEAAKALGAENVAYVLSAVWWSEQLGSKGVNKAFVEAFRARYGRSPEWYHALSYETARVALAAVESAHSIDGEALRRSLASLRVETLLPGGQLSFPAEYGQQARYPFVVLQNQSTGDAAVVYPEYLASMPGIAPNPRCDPKVLTSSGE